MTMRKLLRQTQADLRDAIRRGLTHDVALAIIDGAPAPGYDALAETISRALEAGVDAEALIATVERCARPVRGRLATLDNTDELPDWG